MSSNPTHDGDAAMTETQTPMSESEGPRSAQDSVKAEADRDTGGNGKNANGEQDSAKQDNPYSELFKMQAEIGEQMFQGWAAATGAAVGAGAKRSGGMPETQAATEDLRHWGEVMGRLQAMWSEFQTERLMRAQSELPEKLSDPNQWTGLMESWFKMLPTPSPQRQQAMFEDSVRMWQQILEKYSQGGDSADPSEIDLPMSDRRFADPKWRENPVSIVIHQTYLMLADQLEAMVEEMDGIEPEKQEQMRFVTRSLLEALSPTNFAMTNPMVMERAVETRGENLIRGMENLINDLRRGQLTHTDPDAFTLGENIAVTPGKVVHETPLYQLIQYSPTTDEVLKVPLVIFPPWINRYYILDLNPKKSFVRWAIEQGLTVFMVSWKSADETMADVVWDDYVAAQIEAIKFVRKRLDVKKVHAIGYCVAGTTLAATLAVLARKGKAKHVKSATFFTAQVDFELAGELLNFIDDQQLLAIEAIGDKGFVDGRYLAMTFNMLRGSDLIWNYVAKNYLMGDPYPAFDLLHWNGDVTNLPAKWHRAYLRDLYRDNRLTKPDSLSVLDTPIDLRRVKTPAYIQAGREDHIAPPESVWRVMDEFSGDKRFVLAGSGHIAGVVNPPEAGKYQYWINNKDPHSLAQFIEGATEYPGSWWPDWISWIRDQSDKMVPAKGKRVPGGKGDKVIEDAPGRYVLTR